MTAVEPAAPPIIEVRVLVVEDHQATRTCLCKLLESYGYTCSSAANGAEALARVRAFRPHAVIMDYNMPVLDGLAATRQLKANPETRLIPVVALTANGTREAMEQALLAGVSGFLTKPTDLSDLVSQLRLVAPLPTT
jgi:CheY-like chemotaxis protein